MLTGGGLRSLKVAAQGRAHLEWALTGWRVLLRRLLWVAAAHILRTLTTLFCRIYAVLLLLFTGGKPEEQGGLAVGLRSHRWYVVNVGCRPRVWLQSQCFLLKSLSWFEWETLKEWIICYLQMSFRDCVYCLQAFEVENGLIILVLWYAL